MKFKTTGPMPQRKSKRRDDGLWGEVQGMLDEIGLPIPERPVEHDGPPLLPEDLTDLGDEQLMDYFTKYVRWLEYAGTQLARAEALADESDTLLVRAQAASMRRSWTGAKEDRVTIAKADRDLDPDVQRCEKNALTLGAYAKALKTLYDGIERKVSLVSRELTRRTSIEPYERRTHRWSGG